MTPGFPPDRLFDCLPEIVVAGAFPKRMYQIHFHLPQKAEAHPAVGSQPGPGTGGAEGLGDGADEADYALGPRQSV